MHRTQEAPLIELSHVTKIYGAFRAMDDVSLEVRAGEALALLGPNGSGKTTTLKCMAGLVRPTAGCVRIAGCDPTRGAKSRSVVSYLPQHVSFDEQFTCREVLEFFRRLRRLASDRVKEVLDEWEIREVADRPVRELSGGTRQRLGIAVMALPDAPVLLLDEPTASLDPATALLLRQRLPEWTSSGKAVAFASHTLTDVEAAADRVAIFFNGRVTAVEPVETLRSELRAASLEEIYLRHIDEANPVGRRTLERMRTPAGRTRSDRSR